MERILDKISNIGVNLDSNSLVEVARYWFWKEVISDVVRSSGMLIFILTIAFVAYKIAKKYGTRKWN